MPRGVYDRSKIGKKDSSEKVAKPAKAAKAPKAEKSAAPKGKPGRKPKTASTATVSTARAEGNYGDLHLMGEVRENIKVLTSLVGVFGKTEALTEEISAHLEILTDLRSKAFPANTPVEVKAEEAKTVTPVAPPNGAYTSQVPLPPTPVVVPTPAQ